MRTAAMAAALVLGTLAVAPAGADQARTAAPPPVLVFETVKGTFEMELFTAEAPRSTARLLELVRRSFYRGQRFHRVTNSLAQLGDPATRNMTLQAQWGGGGSGSPIGVAEISKSRRHVRGAVGLAHSGNAAWADSQFYVMKTASPGLDGEYTIVGRVVTGMAVIDRIERTDRIVNNYVKGEGPK